MKVTNQEVKEALQGMLDLWEDTLKSNKVGNMTWQNYAASHEAPAAARKVLEKVSK